VDLPLSSIGAFPCEGLQCRLLVTGTGSFVLVRVNANEMILKIRFSSVICQLFGAEAASDNLGVGLRTFQR